MTALRLIADDLTGALDSAAAFAAVLGPVRTVWDVPGADPGSLVLDSGTREAKREDAARRVGSLAPLLTPASGRISFFKVDSLLRGHAGAELAAILDRVHFDAVVIAPAIPFQNRRTRNGRQMRLEPGGWVNTGEDIVTTLNNAGHFVAVLKPGDLMPGCISMWDAETDADLDAIVAASTGDRSVLYVGAAGLASALARRIGPVRAAALPALPLLGLIGTDHTAMVGQLAAIGDNHLRMGLGVDDAAREVGQRLVKRGFCFVSCALPPTGRETARAEIARRFNALALRLPRPQSLFLSGGETLAAFCRDLGATGLDVHGEFETGLPLSTLVGGAWDGASIISKSGAFGAPDILQRLVSAMVAAHQKAFT